MLCFQGVFGGGDPPSAGIDLRRERLSRVVEQGGEKEDCLFMGSETGPLFEQRQLGADHLRVGPDIPLGMPPLILLALGHRPSPRLVFSPGQDVAMR